ncbi:MULTISPECIES: class I SAM-dependent DNA methyltransferase [Marinobacter]|uniref:site-specific DNA-methyltransferase (adenine-specific) n=1 Tax=Marinobacter sp. MMG032 TaxID=3158548 RepID=A0AAU7MTI4_9GAMM|nr:MULTISPECIES: DNA methyltransferase [Marinobacter]MBY5939056.1 class I SAM-dependent DNA methyltransferase [Marinobacter nauticus]MBY5956429.1 class I SAM-dependent DNA methyltransferase [Marinobacter nauticus]MBY6010243.1 class I SAM-dependent DNA methyltransferase [Marinobacter nauticus]
MEAIAVPSAVDNFLKRWKGNSGSERSNFQSFMRDLCTLLDLPLPDPGEGDTSQNSYVFERFIASPRVDGNTESRYIDLYRRDCFVLEGKQTGKQLASRSHQNAINAAVAQAERYIRGLPFEEVEHGRPPFIVIVDVGNAIYTYSEFTRTGGNYVPFPDPRHFEIRLDDLHKPEIQQRLRQLWLDPDKLDPSKHAAKVTREVSTKLAELARSLERSGYDVERVASFLKRCLFTMFAEDVELLPRESFQNLLVDIKDRNPEAFPHAVKALWDTMNAGGYSERLMQTVKRFNGGLFKNIDPIPLNAGQIQLLIDASKADWRFVEPAIFGTLLERALDPRERHKLGAHYTPRAYVERLVMPTLIEPLREQWGDIRGAAETLLRQGKDAKALQQVQAFHYQLCQTHVLDPACGSANFLYVALEHMKRLEGEVLGFISELTQGQGVLESEGLTVDPHQFLGLELNPRAAQIAELVLWIGYLQWHYRLNDRLDLPEPILKDFKNIECRDALIEYDSREPELDDNGQPVTIWDGISMKVSQTTGELIPDETGRATVYRYHNPRRAEWPKADYIIGNPPFIGASTMRRSLGDGYVDAVRQVFKGVVPDSADFVMYWWHTAAENVRKGNVQRFGFITTNSLKQTFNRRVLEPHLNDTKKPLSLVFAVPDHPWVDVNDGAAVRIAMTVGMAGEHPGQLRQVIRETSSENREARDVQLSQRAGKLFADLTTGANVASAEALEANEGISSPGVKLHGSGFIVTPEESVDLGLGRTQGLEHVIREYRNGRDLTQKPRGVKVIDLFGLKAEEVREYYPTVYQWVRERVKPERDQNKRATYRDNWWLFGEPRKDWREMSRGLPRYIATVETTKHRLFTFLNAEILPDNKLINIAIDDSAKLGVLGSRIHVAWSFSTGSRLGVGNDPVYVKSRCFETFPFPIFNADQSAIIGSLAERIDAHRKRQQHEYPSLTLTNIYNVLEKLRSGDELTDKEKTIHQQGLIAILRELHDELDHAVFEAYGWSDLEGNLVGRPGATTPLPDKPADQAEAEEELLMRLVDLNKQRAEEESRGIVRWLRPGYQAPDAVQTAVDIAPKAAAATSEAVTSKSKAAFPKAIPDQLRVLREALAERSYTTENLAGLFKRKPVKSVEEGLQSLVAVGMAGFDAHTQTWYSM